MLRVQGLKKEYVTKKETVVAVDGISFEVPKGELLGLLGPNGAGKTTTVKMICGLIRPDSGRVFVEGVDVHENRNEAMGKLSAVLEGNRNIYWRLNALENLRFFASLKGRNPKALKEEIDYYVDFFQLKDQKHREARKLSRGMQQKLALAVAMVCQSKLLLLDEPTLGLDVKASYEIRELLLRIVKEQDRTVILTTHDMNVVQDVCERVIIINKGKIVASDLVKSLLRIFEQKVYRMEVAGTLSEAQKKALQGFPKLELILGEGVSTITVGIDTTAILHSLIGILAQEESELLSMKSLENNLERVFMEIIKGGAGDGGSFNPS